MESGFDPESVVVRETPVWVTLQGNIPSSTTHVPSSEEVLDGESFDINDLPLRDPEQFVSGQIHRNSLKWQEMLGNNDQGGNVLAMGREWS